MELSIQKWGNGAALRLPAALLDRIQLAPGDKVEVDSGPRASCSRDHGLDIHWWN